ncbi:hypothetical protein PX52LOC_04054 [Limnoglobus roseus]|uniref:Uncharacterized protein n=2 Tax=Limnoglobus roseus TaxID=2598579 RepID=A0A5C1AJK1_9BACT|nr:hypothetical protein PX52LOC_04054 [Limnoglobus roseus]
MISYFVSPFFAPVVTTCVVQRCCPRVAIPDYFTRDLQEMLDSAFRRDGPGSLKTVGTITIGPRSAPTLETAVTDDEVRSFVTIFRRLYMENEPANFLKATDVFIRAMGDHPYGRWVAGVAAEYRSQLAGPPDVPPFLSPGTCTFTTKRLIDVFLYTQYAHQPDAKRQRQFSECLTEVYGHRSVLTWLFFTTIWQASLVMGNAGRVISGWFGRYCQEHGITPDVLNSLRHDHSGLGAAEKAADRQARLFREKVDALAMDIWRQHGCPEAGPGQFVALAREQLERALGRGSLYVEGQP